MLPLHALLSYRSRNHKLYSKQKRNQSISVDPNDAYVEADGNQFYHNEVEDRSRIASIATSFGRGFRSKLVKKTLDDEVSYYEAPV